MLSETEILHDVTQKLDASGIAYMLTGSVALSFYAQPRMTRDIDIVVAITEQDAPKILRAFSGDYYISPEDVMDTVHGGPMFNIVHLQSVVKVDLIALPQTDFAAVQFQRRQQVNFGGFPISIISREDLILSKLVWAKDTQSEVQRNDVRNLLGAECDIDYLQLWAENLGVIQDLETLMNQNG